MNTAISNTNELKLVGREVAWEHAARHHAHGPQILQPFDPRWVFAVYAAQFLVRPQNCCFGGDARESALHRATAMGLSRHAAINILAIVGAEIAAGREPLGPMTETKLVQLANPFAKDRAEHPGVPLYAVVIVTALVMGAFAFFALA
ncbi:MAG: hypothetical protein ACF8Q5_06310 [Phycisphaerales bacterium JB040]